MKRKSGNKVFPNASLSIWEQTSDAPTAALNAEKWVRRCNKRYFWQGRMTTRPNCFQIKPDRTRISRGLFSSDKSRGTFFHPFLDPPFRAAGRCLSARISLMVRGLLSVEVLFFGLCAMSAFYGGRLSTAGEKITARVFSVFHVEIGGTASKKLSRLIYRASSSCFRMQRERERKSSGYVSNHAKFLP